MKLLCLLLALLMTSLTACAPKADEADVIGTPVPLVEAGAEYVADLEQLAVNFSAAYFSNDADAMRELLASGFCGTMDAYPGDKDKVVIVAMKGIEQGAQDYAASGECVLSVEFKEYETADSYTYLTIEVCQGESGPKVSFYGLEG